MDYRLDPEAIASHALEQLRAEHPDVVLESANLTDRATHYAARFQRQPGVDSVGIDIPTRFGDTRSVADFGQVMAVRVSEMWRDLDAMRAKHRAAAIESSAEIPLDADTEARIARLNA
jgi:hypothetical protein